ncbi:MAG: dihydropteroate synthase [Bacteroidota bacterium]
MHFNRTINIKGEILDLSLPRVMGIINITPDSFFSGSRKNSIKEVLKTAERMLLEGATFLDVGGYSSRPGAQDILESEELNRIIEPIKAITKEFPKAILSIDTFRSKIAREGVNAGAKMINDISGGNLDERMLKTIVELDVPYIAMHMRGTPQTMTRLTNYDDILKEVVEYFSNVIRNCNDLGVKDVIIDPGFGFSKTVDQSFRLLKDLEYFRWLERPLLVGVSRKSMIYRTLNVKAEEALNGTSVLNTLALFRGARILRVHDVKEAIETVKLVNQLK